MIEKYCDRVFGINVKSREVYLDVIRIFAVYLVIFTHTGAYGSKLYVYEEYSEIRNALYIAADVIRTISVPLFFMISGTLMLGADYSYKKIVLKMLPKYVIGLIIASYFYYAVFFQNNPLDIAGFLKNLWTNGNIGILWYMYVYIGYLLMLPLLQKMIKLMQKADYIMLLVLWVLLYPVNGCISSFFNCGDSFFSIPLLVDSVVYPILGYFFGRYIEFDRVIQNSTILLMLLGGTMGVLLSSLLIRAEYLRTGVYSEKYIFSCTAIIAMATFCTFRKIFSRIKNRTIVALFAMLGECTYGVYLISMYVQNNKFGVYNLAFKVTKMPLLSGYIYVMGVLVISIIIIWILKNVPIINKVI